MILTNSNLGLGDTISLFCFQEGEWANIKIASASPLFSTLAKFCPAAQIAERADVRVEILQEKDRTLGRHFFNKIRVFCGLEELAAPRAFLKSDRVKIGPKPKICFSFDVGKHAAIQRAKIHPHARMLYPRHKESIQKFINDNCHTYEFVEVGNSSKNFQNVTSLVGIGLERTIWELAAARAYFGMHSGMMHLAVALGVPSVILLNFPKAEQIKFPWDEEAPDLDWLYPQDTVKYLHEDEGAGCVPIMSYDSFSEAMATFLGSAAINC